MSAATMEPMALTTGAVTIQPNTPPAASIAAAPSLGVGAPWTRCHRPSTPIAIAVPPMMTRPVAARASG